MILRRVFEPGIAQAGYLVGCGATGEAIVIDPLRDIDPYLRIASEEGLTIVAVTETHIHADYLSGTRELAAKVGAHMYLSDEGGPDWTYTFGSEQSVTLVRHGDVIKTGNLSLRVIHTPGHTPEHISFVLTDHPASELPHSIFSGDFVFVGDVGRPDLLERAAHMEGTMERGAKTLFSSLKELRDWPDSLLIWPAHGAGSACGKSLGGVPVSSLGYERASNWGLNMANEEDFVKEVLSGQPEPPLYFKEMKRLNKLGPTILGEMPHPRQMSIQELPDLLNDKRQVVDTRSHDEIRAGLIPNTIAIPGGKSFATWAGWFLKYEEPIWLLAASQSDADRVARDLALIGLDDVIGWIDSNDVHQLPDPWIPERVSSLDARNIDPTIRLIDVRSAQEFLRGSVLNAQNIPVGLLEERSAELDQNVPYGVFCQAGGRSLMAISVLRRLGYEHVKEIPAGYEGLSKV